MKSLFVNCLPGSQRMAFTRDGTLEAFRIASKKQGNCIGDISLGRVTKVLPGIQAAFIDIGAKEPVFLARAELPSPLGKAPLVAGRELMVQLRRQGYGNKADQVSAFPKLVGFSGILMPYAKGIRFSREFDGDQQAFRDAMATLPQDPSMSLGWIVRSAAASMGLERAMTEYQQLLAQFLKLKDEAKSGANRLLYRDDPLLEMIRDRGIDNWRSIYLDDTTQYERVQLLLREQLPELLPALKLHLDDMPLFDTYKLESEIDKVCGHKVWLKSGGWLEIEATQAMVTVDVNSGKAGKDRGGLSTALRTNLEAVEELARQVRVRNLAGLICIDFINARDKGWRKRIDDALGQALKRDQVETDLVGVNKLGVAMISRRRERLTLNQLMTDDCPSCRGSGRLPKRQTIAMDIIRKLRRDGANMAGETFLLRCGSDLTRYLQKRHDLLFKDLEQAMDIKVRVEPGEGTPRSWSVEIG